MVGAQPWRYGHLELVNLSMEQDYFVVGSSCSDVTRRVICFYFDNDGDYHRLHDDKGQGQTGDGRSLKVSSEFQNCEAT